MNSNTMIKGRMMPDTAQHEPCYRVLITPGHTVMPGVDNLCGTDISRLYVEGLSAPDIALLLEVHVSRINKLIDGAARAKRRKRRKRESEARLMAFGVDVRAKMKHGTQNTYRKGCRCDECMTVKSLGNQNQRQRRLRLAEGTV